MRRALTAAALLALLCGAFGALLRLEALAEGDPDRFYHIALSRLAVEEGRLFLRALPQVADLGWGENFIDKEFLFHQLTTLGFAVAGERGVVGASFLCAVLSLAAFFLFGASRAPLPAAGLITLLTFFSPFLAFRLSMLRPQTLAVLCFTLFNMAALARRPGLTAAAAFFFTLSYHAFYVPLGCAGLLFGLSWLERGEASAAWRRLALQAGLGCIAGLLVNPYFPGNILLAVIHARIPDLMRGELRGAPFGEELIPVRSDQYFEAFHGPLLVLFLSAILLGLELARGAGERSREFRLRLLYLIGVCCFFLYASFRITRAGEYLFPACGLLIVVLVERWREKWRAVTGLLLLLAIAQGMFLRSVVRERLGGDSGERTRETFRAISSIPREAPGAKVFNCEWDRTPYLLYARPDLRFVDILDPSLLYFSNSSAYRAREELKQGLVADASGLIRDAFKADFVLCGDPALSEQLRSDPGFQQLYPPVQLRSQPGTVPSVFRVLRERPPAFVTSLLATELREPDPARLDPPPAGALRRQLELDKTPFLNLAALFPSAEAGGPLRCAFVSPSGAELARLKGAAFLGIGGGQGFKVWRNGRPLFTTREGFSALRMVQVLVPLDTPVRARDRIEVLACSAASAGFWGVSLSLWRERELQALCQRKTAALAPRSSELPGWDYQGLHSLTCLAPLAAPAPPPAISQPETANHSRSSARP